MSRGREMKKTLKIQGKREVLGRHDEAKKNIQVRVTELDYIKSCRKKRIIQNYIRLLRNAYYQTGTSFTPNMVKIGQYSRRLLHTHHSLQPALAWKHLWKKRCNVKNADRKFLRERQKELCLIYDELYSYDVDGIGRGEDGEIGEREGDEESEAGGGASCMGRKG